MKKVFIATLIIFITSLVLLIVSFRLGFKALNAKEFFTDSYKYEEVPEVVIEDEITKLDYKGQTKNIIINTHDEEKILINYNKHKHEEITIKIENNTLIINQVKNTKWYHNIGINFGFSDLNKMVITLPKALIDITITNTVGNVSLSDISGNNLKLDVTTGNININALEFIEKITVNSHVGNINVENIKTNILNLEATTGNIKIKNSKQDITNIETSTGNVVVENIESNTINIDVSTGDVKLKIDYLDYKLIFKTNTGNVRVNGSNQGSSYTKLEGSKTITVNSSTGNITINLI